MTAFGTLTHLALTVADVAAAESFYQEFFDMQVRFREGQLGDTYGRVPDDLDWGTANARGVEPGMSFLERGGLTLGVAEGETPEARGVVDHVGITVGEEALATYRRRAAALDCSIDDHESTIFVEDPFGVEWEIKSGPPTTTCPFEPLSVKPE